MLPKIKIDGGDLDFEKLEGYSIYMDCKDVPLPYAPQLMDDIINRTETAMTQEHSFLAMELAIKAENMADRLGNLK